MMRVLFALPLAVVVASQPPPPYALVYVQKESGSVGAVDFYVSRADGTGATLISQERSAVFTPNSWSPKGARIVFQSIRDTDEPLLDACPGYSNRALYMVTIDDEKGTVGKPERLTDVLAVGGFSWSPDGSRLAFSSACQNPKRAPRKDATVTAVYVLDLATRKVERLTDFAPFGSPSWSPDGKQIAADGREAGSAEMGIHIMDADGKNDRRIADGIQPRWSPTGDRLAYMRSTALFVVGTDGSNKKNVEVMESGTDYEWSPDGGSLLVGSREAILINLTPLNAAIAPKTYLGAPGMERGFSADGKSILMARSDSIVSLDPATKPLTPRVLVKAPPRYSFEYSGFAIRPQPMAK